MEKTTLKNEKKSFDFLNGMHIYSMTKDGFFYAGHNSLDIRYEGKILSDGIIITKQVEYINDYDDSQDVCFCQHGERPEECDICHV